MSFLHRRACTDATELSTILASLVSTLFFATWHWLPSIPVVVLQRFPGRTRALTSTGPLNQVYLCFLFLSPSTPLPQDLMGKGIRKALVIGDASHIGQGLDVQHVPSSHIPLCIASQPHLLVGFCEYSPVFQWRQSCSYYYCCSVFPCIFSFLLGNPKGKCLVPCFPGIFAGPTFPVVVSLSLES